MREDVLERISQLECVDVAQTELDMRIHDKFRQAKDLTTQMERVSETGLFALLGC